MDGCGCEINTGQQCLPLFHFHPNPTLKLSQVALLQRGVSALLTDPPRHARAHPTATLTTLTIVLALETRAVPLATIRTAEEETIIVATIDDMTLGTTSLIEGIMTAEEIMTATVRATMTTVVTDAALFVTATGIEPTTAAVIMKNGILTVDATNATIMTVTVDAIAHRADVPGVGGGIRDRGHPAVVHVSLLSSH
jgi:hypothetical protein